MKTHISILALLFITLSLSAVTDLKNFKNPSDVTNLFKNGTDTATSYICPGGLIDTDSRSGTKNDFKVESTGTDLRDDVVISSFPHIESFEGSTFPPAGWVLGSVTGPHNLELETRDPLNPTTYDTPHGDKWIHLQSDPEAQNSAILWSPRLDFPAGNTFYQITISIYVTNTAPSYIQINRSSSQGIFGPDRGHISNTDNSTSVGWHDYSIGLGYLGGTSQYISLTVGDINEDINFDNIRIEAGNPWSNIYPYDNSTNVTYVWSGWSDYTVYEGSYSLYFSTDNTNFNLEYQGVNNSTTLGDASLLNTTYYWYVVAQEYGNTRISPTWSFTTVADVLPFQFVESFEGVAYPPAGWELRNNSGDPSIELMTNDPVNPTAYDTTYGDKWVRLPVKPGADNNGAALVSPRIDFPAGDGYYRLTMSVYITNNTNSDIRISRMTALWGGDSYDVGYVSNTSSTLSVGWQEYTCSLGFLGGTSQYIMLSAASVLEDVRFDNIRIEEATPWIGRYPLDGATDVEVNPWVYWSDYYVSTNTYSVYFSADGYNYSSVYEGVSNGTSFANPLEYYSTYWWYIVANEYGNTVTSPIWTFTTINNTPNIDEVIFDFPYLADYQIEDPLWYSFLPRNKGNSCDLNTLLANYNPLIKPSPGESKESAALWERTQDGEANFAYWLPGGYGGYLVGPYFYLEAGQTYEIKYNYRHSEYFEPSGAYGVAIMSYPQFSDNPYLDFNTAVSNTGYALRMITVTPEISYYYTFIIAGISLVDLYVDNFRITQNGDDVLTAAAATVDGVSAPNPAPIYNTETLQPLDTDLQIANITGTPEVTATLTWTAPAVGSQNTGLKLSLHSSSGGLAGATVTFIHNLGYPPLSVAYRIVPNAYTTMYNPNDGSWNATQCLLAIPAGKADGDYEVILRLNENQTLPIELSSFTAIATQQNFVQLNWTTQSETGVSGYYIYRNSTDILESAQVVSNLICANNTSQEQTYMFKDEEVLPGTWYYWLQNMDMDGQVGFHGSISVVIQNTDDGNTPVIPMTTSLQSIYPNPFNPSTTIAFGLAKAELVNIQIYNIKGQIVRTLLSETRQSAIYRLQWNGTNDMGHALASGIYYVKMTAGIYTATTKIALLK